MGAHGARLIDVASQVLAIRGGGVGLPLRALAGNVVMAELYQDVGRMGGKHRIQRPSSRKLFELRPFMA